MIIFTDSNYNFEYFKKKYNISVPSNIFRLQNYKGSWINAFPFDPANDYRVCINEDVFLLNLLNHEYVVIDFNFFSSFELVGLFALNLDKLNIKKIDLVYSKDATSEFCLEYMDLISNIDYIKKFAILKRMTNAMIYLSKPWIKNLYHLKFIIKILEMDSSKKIISSLNSKNINKEKLTDIYSGIFWPILDLSIDDLPLIKDINFTSYASEYVNKETDYNKNVFKNRVSSVIRSCKFNFCNIKEDDWYLDSIFDILNLEQNDRMSCYRGVAIPCGLDILRCNSISSKSMNNYYAFNYQMDMFMNTCRELINFKTDINTMCKNIWKVKNDI